MQLQAKCLSAALLLGLNACGATDRYTPADLGESTASSTRADIPTKPKSSGSVSITGTNSAGARGMLDLTAIGAMQQSLGSLDVTVRNRAGILLARGLSDVQGNDDDRRLLLELPAGSDYSVSLDSSSDDDSAPKCHAKITSLRIEPDATATYQAFLWQCEMPALPKSTPDCYALADFVGSSRTRAQIGESIDLHVAGFDDQGAPAQVSWASQAPFGSLSDAHAASTTFTCAAPSDSVPLDVVVTGDDCSRQLTLNVACR
jgi:hypothetical protein